MWVGHSCPTTVCSRILRPSLDAALWQPPPELGKVCASAHPHQTIVPDATALPTQNDQAMFLQPLQQFHRVASARLLSIHHQLRPPPDDDSSSLALFHLRRVPELPPASILFPLLLHALQALCARPHDSPSTRYAATTSRSDKRSESASHSKCRAAACACCTHLATVTHPRYPAWDQPLLFSGAA